MVPTLDSLSAFIEVVINGTSASDTLDLAFIIKAGTCSAEAILSFN